LGDGYIGRVQDAHAGRNDVVVDIEPDVKKDEDFGLRRDIDHWRTRRLLCDKGTRSIRYTATSGIHKTKTYWGW
jgi:hypothetical protein